MPPTFIIGATGRSGQAVCRALLAAGEAVVPVVRDAARWAATGIALEARVADLTGEMRLDGAQRVVSCAHARFAPAILAAAPAGARFVFLGSTRKFTRWPDAHGNGVLAGEAAFQASGRAGVMLHPTMIYGARGEDNVRRLAALLRRLPVVPLPGGGRALVQPIYQDDVTRAILASLAHPWSRAESLVIAGPQAMPYADFVRAVAHAAGLGRRPVLGVPLAPLLLAARLWPGVSPDEVRRLSEDKAFDIAPMRARLGLEPLTLAAGLRLLFGDAGSLNG